MFKEVKSFSGFSVKDVAIAKEFYSQTLGLEVSETMGQLILNLAGGANVLVYGKENHVPATYTVLNFPVKDLKAAMQQLRNKGLKFIIYKEEGFETDDEGVFHGGGPEIAWFKDPSDNILSVLQENPDNRF